MNIRTVIMFILLCMTLSSNAQQSKYEAEILRADKLMETDMRKCYDVIKQIPESAVSKMNEEYFHLYYYLKGSSDPVWFEPYGTVSPDAAIRSLKKVLSGSTKSVKEKYYGDFLRANAILGLLYKNKAILNNNITYLDTAKMYYTDAYVGSIGFGSAYNDFRDNVSYDLYEICMEIPVYQVADWIKNVHSKHKCYVSKKINSNNNEFKASLDKVENEYDRKYVRNSAEWAKAMADWYEMQTDSLEELYGIDLRIDHAVEFYKKIGSDKKFADLRDQCLSFILYASYYNVRWNILLDYIDDAINDPTNTDLVTAWCYFLKAVALDAKGQSKQCLDAISRTDAYFKSKDCNPNDKILRDAIKYRNQGREAFRLGQYDKAIELYKKSESINPSIQNKNCILKAELMKL